MGRPFVHLCADDENARYTCRTCGVDVANSSAVIWSGHMGLQKPAFLLRGCTGNVIPISPPRQERLHSAMYTLQTVACRCCTTELGWLYLKCHGAAEQTYKEGAMLLEQALLRASPSRSSLAVARAELAKMQQRTSTATATTRGNRSTHRTTPAHPSHNTPSPISPLPLPLSSLSTLTQLAGLSPARGPRGMGPHSTQPTQQTQQTQREGHEEVPPMLGAILGRMAQRAQRAQRERQQLQQQGGEGVGRRGLSRRVSWQDGEAMQMDEDEPSFSVLPDEDEDSEEGAPLLLGGNRSTQVPSDVMFSLEHMRALRRQEAAEDMLSLTPRQPSFTQGRPQLIGRPSSQGQGSAPSIDTTAHMARTWIQGDPLPPRSSSLQLVHARLANLESAPSGSSPDAVAARQAALTDIDQALNMMIAEAQQAQGHMEQATADEQPPQDDDMQDAGTAEDEEEEVEEEGDGDEVAGALDAMAAGGDDGGEDDDEEDPIEEDDSEEELADARAQFVTRAELLHGPSLEEQQEQQRRRQQGRQQREGEGDDTEEGGAGEGGRRVGLDRSQEEAWVLDGLQQEATINATLGGTPGTQDTDPEDSELHLPESAPQPASHPVERQYQRIDQQLAERQLRPPQVRGRRLPGTFHFSARPRYLPALLRGERTVQESGDRERAGARSVEGLAARGTRLAWPESSTPMIGRRRQIDDGAREGLRGVEAPGAGAEPIPCLPSRNIRSRTAPAW